MSAAPVGFMSYVRFDDEHENGRLTQFCERLSGEIRAQTGENFPIFQDRKDIAWGQQWKERLEDSLDAVTFLIPIITPGFFKSAACRQELERFLEREKQLGRGDLILPVYYINCPILDDEEKRKRDPLATLIATRQRADWRELRFEPFTSPQVGKMIARMAAQVVEAMDRAAPAQPPVASRGGQTSEAASAQMSGRVIQKTEPPTRVVDAFHRGNHATLTEALLAAKPGDRILVRPGYYKEGVIIDKPVEIIGDGELGEVVIEATGSHTIAFRTGMGRIANLKLRQSGGGEWYCVDVTQGRLEIEGCDISSQSLACVAIHDGADPRLRRNFIHDGKKGGVFVYDNGQGTLEDNEIFGNVLAGIEIRTNANPTIRRNRIRDGKSAGVLVHQSGQGTIEDNEIFGHAMADVDIGTDGNPNLRRNRIHDGKASGVHVHDSGQGTLEDNEILGSSYAGVEVKTGGNPIMRRNRITGSGYQAICVREGGKGTFENNDLRGNTHGSWFVTADCEADVKRSGNQE